MKLRKLAIHWSVISKIPSLLCSFNCSFIAVFAFIRLVFPWCLLLQFALFYREEIGLCTEKWRNKTLYGFYDFALGLKYGEIFQERQSSSFIFTLFQKEAFRATNKGSLSRTSQPFPKVYLL
jgi:hypothetical protein